MQRLPSRDLLRPRCEHAAGSPIVPGTQPPQLGKLWLYAADLGPCPGLGALAGKPPGEEEVRSSRMGRDALQSSRDPCSLWAGAECEGAAPASQQEGTGPKEVPRACTCCWNQRTSASACVSLPSGELVARLATCARLGPLAGAGTGGSRKPQMHAFASGLLGCQWRVPAG